MQCQVIHKCIGNGCEEKAQEEFQGFQAQLTPSIKEFHPFCLSHHHFVALPPRLLNSFIRTECSYFSSVFPLHFPTGCHLVCPSGVQKALARSGKFNRNRLRMPFLLSARSAFYRFSSSHLLFPHFLGLLCISRCIVYISPNGYLFAFYFYVRKQRKFALNCNLFFMLFAALPLLCFCFGVSSHLRIFQLPHFFFANVFYGVLKTTLLNKLVFVLFRSVSLFPLFLFVYKYLSRLVIVIRRP